MKRKRYSNKRHLGRYWQWCGKKSILWSEKVKYRKDYVGYFCPATGHKRHFFTGLYCIHMYTSNTAGVLYEAGNCLTTWVHPCFFSGVHVAHLLSFFCGVLLWVFTLFVPCCEVLYDFRIQTMSGSSLPPVVCRRAHVLFTVYVFFLRIAVSSTHWPIWVVVLFWFSSFCVPMWCQILWIVPLWLSLRYSLTFIYYTKQKIQKWTTEATIIFTITGKLWRAV